MDPTPPLPPPQRIPPERLELVEAMWLEARSPREIQALCSTKWKITKRQVRTYIRIVRQRLAKLDDGLGYAAGASGKARAEEMLLEVWELAKNASFKGQPMPDTKTMERVATRLAELDGAIAPKKVELDASGLAEFLGIAFGEEGSEPGREGSGATTPLAE